jgi:hypothetical protein
MELGGDRPMRQAGGAPDLEPGAEVASQQQDAEKRLEGTHGGGPDGAAVSEATVASAPPPVASPEFAAAHVLKGHTRAVSAVKHSPDGSLLASACEFGAWLQATRTLSLGESCGCKTGQAPLWFTLRAAFMSPPGEYLLAGIVDARNTPTRTVDRRAKVCGSAPSSV